MVQYTYYKHEVGVEGKPKPEVFLGVWGSERSAWRVRIRVFDDESNSSNRTRLRSIVPEEGVTRERYLGVGDVLREESFCWADYVWFVSGNLCGKICKVGAKALDI